MLMFRQAGVRRNRRQNPQSLTLDENAVAHIDFLIDRGAREFVVLGNGIEMFRWRDPAPLEGDFVHFGITFILIITVITTCQCETIPTADIVQSKI